MARDGGDKRQRRRQLDGEEEAAANGTHGGEGPTGRRWPTRRRQRGDADSGGEKRRRLEDVVGDDRTVSTAGEGEGRGGREDGSGDGEGGRRETTMTSGGVVERRRRQLQRGWQGGTMEDSDDEGRESGDDRKEATMETLRHDSDNVDNGWTARRQRPMERRQRSCDEGGDADSDDNVQRRRRGHCREEGTREMTVMSTAASGRSDSMDADGERKKRGTT